MHIVRVGLLLLPNQSACHVKDANLRFHHAVGLVVVDGEVENTRSLYRVGVGDDGIDVRVSTFRNDEVERSDRTVVQQVPCAEGETVCSFFQLGKHVRYHSSLVTAVLGSEEIVEDIVLLGVVVHDEQKVVSYTCSGCIDTMLVFYLREEARCLVGGASIYKSRSI